MSSWIQDIVDPNTRSWEEFYRNRWSHDKVIRSTHGVNCTGSCGWMVYVKDGIVTWEMQALDYTALAGEIPPYEPRGCQRGISYSWYLYSPLRVKYPYLRGVLMDLWREARKVHADPVAAWLFDLGNRLEAATPPSAQALAASPVRYVLVDPGRCDRFSQGPALERCVKVLPATLEAVLGSPTAVVAGLSLWVL